MWEYQFVYFQFFNDKTLRGFNEDGKLGWELVQIIYGEHVSECVAVFKKEKVIV